jgi:hypothetical protein
MYVSLVSLLYCVIGKLNVCVTVQSVIMER